MIDSVYKGIVKGDVVVLEKGKSIPEGTKVIVIPDWEMKKSRILNLTLKESFGRNG